ncbi:MAG: cyclohexanone monooxygenase [Panacagrimonas sp.]|nr:NAD(P)/FAD-dependent oxidoreductase [Panacagrimonas sp.]MCC2655150.1 cyclohexanone monooxygenase [Panacagrimonas sp.]
MSASTDARGARPSEVEVAVIGAGFAGMHMVYKLRSLGLSYRAFEKGSGVGGTWYWNRYPGASSDSESWVYSFAFDKDLEQEWNWSKRFPEQPEILGYLQYAAKKFDLEREFDFNTTVTACTYDEKSSRWIVETDKGDRVIARFLVTAVGCLSAAQLPQIPGLESFKGRWYHTGQWPHEPVDFTGKRVGVVGTGSSGIQSIPIIANQAKHLTVFQRTPNFSVPARNRLLSEQERNALKRDIREIRERCRWASIGQPYDAQPVAAMSVSDEERRKQYEANWAKGGFEWMFGSYNDLLVDEKANDTAAEFVREKIRAIVKDPEKARKLLPKGYPIGTKRLPLDQEYFETYNRDNVDLVDIRETPIEQITADGIQTSDKKYELDAIVFATGFDALTGPVTRLNIRGRGGQKIEQKWAEGPRTYLGVATLGFPNLFMITGPGSPSVLGNMPTSIEQHVDWISDCMLHLRKQGATTIEPTAAAEEKWGQHVKELADTTLFPQTDSWYMGANIPGKPRVFMPYIGGFGTYRKLCNEVAEKGYEGFAIK